MNLNKKHNNNISRCVSSIISNPKGYTWIGHGVDNTQ